MTSTYVIQDQLHQAYELWKEITGLDLDESTITVSMFDDQWDNYSMRKYIEDILEAENWEADCMTAFMLMRGMANRYLKHIKFSAHDILTNPELVKVLVEPLNKLRTILEAPHITQQIEAFRLKTEMGLRFYGWTKMRPNWSEMAEMLADPWELAHVRRDAFKSMEDLKEFQFVQGNPAKEPAQYSPNIYEFWNVNSVLQAARSQFKPGISLCLIRDPENALRSYFAFLIVNGDNLSILTDQTRVDNPGAQSRRPDRELEYRASQHNFPYQLLKLERVGEKEELTAKRRKDLVPLNEKVIVLGKMTGIWPYQAVWLAYMFDMIRERYYNDRPALQPPQAYTGEMVRVPDAVAGEHGVLVREGHYQTLELPVLKSTDGVNNDLFVEAELARAKSLGKEPRSSWTTSKKRMKAFRHQWMIERYSDQIRQEHVDVVGTEQPLALPEAAEATGLSQWQRNVSQRHQHIAEIELKTLEPTQFGTTEEIEADRLWIARHNSAKVIQRAANNEYEEKHNEIMAWYRERVHANSDQILGVVALGELIGPKWDYRYELDSAFGSHRTSGRPKDRRKPANRDKSEKLPSAAQRRREERRKKVELERIKSERNEFEQLSANLIQTGEGADWQSKGTWGLNEREHYYRSFYESRHAPDTMHGGRSAGNDPDRSAVLINVNEFFSKWKHNRGFQRYAGGPAFGATQCYVNPEAKATIWAYIKVNHTDTISWLTATDFEDLPWQLQTYNQRTNESGYHGNPILNRTDPLLGSLENPWAELNLGVAIGLSKPSYQALRKAQGLSKATWWIGKREEVRSAKDFGIGPFK